MAPPEIGIVSYHLRPGRVTNWNVGGYGLPENYVDAVRRAGGLDVAATIDVVEEALRLHAEGDTRLPSKSALLWSDELGSELSLWRNPIWT